MPKENVDAWIKSGYAVIPKDDLGGNEGNVEASLNDGGDSEINYQGGGKSQHKFGKNKKKKKKKNR